MTDVSGKSNTRETAYRVPKSYDVCDDIPVIIDVIMSRCLLCVIHTYRYKFIYNTLEFVL